MSHYLRSKIWKFTTQNQLKSSVIQLFKVHIILFLREISFHAEWYELVYLKLIELAENSKLHQNTPIFFLTLFQMIYFLYPERFPFLISRLKEKTEVELNEALSVLIYFP